MGKCAISKALAHAAARCSAERRRIGFPPGGLRGPSPPATSQRHDVLLHRQRRLVRRESGGRTVRLASTSLLAKVSSQRNPLSICQRPTHESSRNRSDSSSSGGH